MKKTLIALFIVTSCSYAYAVTGNISVEGRTDVTGNVSAANLYGNGSNITNFNATQLASGTMADARLSTTVVTTAETRAFTNKTITASSNNVAANILKTATTTIDVSALAAPSAGQYLRASSGTVVAWRVPATSESVTGTTESLTTTATQRVIVWAKGDITTTAIVTVELAYNNVVKDRVGVGYTSSIRFPFALIYTEVPGAATNNITVRATGGTLANVKIMVLKLDQ